MGDTLALDASLNGIAPAIGADRRRRLRRAGDGRGTDRPRHRRHPGRDAARGAADRRPRARRPGPRRARPARRRRPHPHHRHPDRARRQRAARLHVDGTGPDGQPTGWDVDLVLVVVGVRPDTDLLVRAGATTGARGAVAVDESMAHRTAADVGGRATASSPTTACSASPTCRWAPPPTSRAGSPARTPSAAQARFAGILGTQVVKVFDLVAARTGLRDARGRRPPATTPLTVAVRAGRPQGATTRAPSPSPSASPATRPPAGCSAPSSSAAGAPRPPNGSTPTPPRCSTT